MRDKYRYPLASTLFLVIVFYAGGIDFTTKSPALGVFVGLSMLLAAFTTHLGSHNDNKKATTNTDRAVARAKLRAKYESDK